MKSELYRKLPSVDEVLRDADIASLTSREGLAAVTDAARVVLQRLREEISAGHLDANGIDLALSGMSEAVERQARNETTFHLRPVINATGVILHTNLGRAPLSEAALRHIQETAAGHSNLEFDVPSGERGNRDVHVDRLFRKLFAEGETSPSNVSTIVVNNNAAAVLLALNTLGDGGEVIVSRGELVEIGGSFRIPDIMGKSNATLREVGTTNRTRISDYEQAINPNTKLLLRVHRSNFQITGFTEQPHLDELAALAHKHSLPLMEDLGSGSLFDLRSIGIDNEPSVLDSLRAGLDVVSYSGDKLLGGPQAGLLTGRADLIARMRSNSLFRALRVDKLTYAALEATLLAYVKHDHDTIPALRMMRLSKDEIGQRADALAQTLREAKTRLSVDVTDGKSIIGGGAAPSATLPTRLLAITCQGLSAQELAAKLRANNPPIIGRVEESRVLLDLRSIFPTHVNVISEALLAIARA
ncbi:MAG TPA: L-seryl-tRNA(Sec) selenium transferase [Terriglobales bacterium]|nr:L-seryl-tRNA(Sec) selenium transferase [Terriglobales bacterium]